MITEFGGGEDENEAGKEEGESGSFPAQHQRCQWKIGVLPQNFTQMVI